MCVIVCKVKGGAKEIENGAWGFVVGKRGREH